MVTNCTSAEITMDVPPRRDVSHQRLIENITLLCMLNEIQGNPKENILPSNDDPARQLTFEREKEIVDNLAFLSATTDDSLRVMAVSAEEDSKQGELTIRIASNTGDLSMVEHGFKCIARILEQAALRGMECWSWCWQCKIDSTSQSILSTMTPGHFYSK